MTIISQIRGALLEEAVLHLLDGVGYEIVEVDRRLDPMVTGLKNGSAGLEVMGRGAWHQVDALALHRHSAPFLYPMRLIVEAKCYRAGRPVGIEVIRNAVGVLRDISENYFSFNVSGVRLKGKRFNYCGAIFSSSGFTSCAIEYSIAHQIFLIQYEKMPAIRPLINAILEFDEDCLVRPRTKSIANVRYAFRSALRRRHIPEEQAEYLSERGWDLIRNALIDSLELVGGSYFGMLQGKWPIHFLSRSPLRAEAFQDDHIRCRIQGNREGGWSFSPVDSHLGDRRWFQLDFSLPDEVAELIADNWDDRLAIASLKQEYFSYVDLSGEIEGVYRNIRLILDRDWLNRYLNR